MKLAQFFILLLILAATANAATTNLSSHTLTTTHGFYEGRVTVGSLANLTSYQLFVTNESRFVRASVNDTLLVGGADVSQATSYHEGPAFFNSTVDFVDGSISRDDLPATIAYEDEANTFAIRQAFLDGVSVGLNSYFTGPVRVNNTLTTTNRLTSTDGTLGWQLQNGGGNADIFLDGSAGLQVNLAGGKDFLFKNGAIIEFGSSGDSSLGECGVSLICTGSADALDVTGTFIASTNSYHEGPARFNLSVDSYNPTGATRVFRGFQGAEVNSRWSVLANGIMQFGPGAGVAEDVNLYRAGSDLLGTDDGLIVALDFELDGALNHDGTLVGLYGKTPVAQHADIPNMVDNTGGTISSTCAAITAGALYAQADMVAVKNCLASLLAKINLLEAAIEEIGITA